MIKTYLLDIQFLVKLLAGLAGYCSEILSATFCMRFPWVIFNDIVLLAFIRTYKQEG